MPKPYCELLDDWNHRLCWRNSLWGKCKAIGEPFIVIIFTHISTSIIHFWKSDAIKDSCTIADVVDGNSCKWRVKKFYQRQLYCLVCFRIDEIKLKGHSLRSLLVEVAVEKLQAGGKCCRWMLWIQEITTPYVDVNKPAMALQTCLQHSISIRPNKSFCITAMRKVCTIPAFPICVAVGACQSDISATLAVHQTV